MPLKIVDHTVTVAREGKSVTVQPGTAFNFTKEELADVESAVPGSTRDPVDEGKGVATKSKAELKAELKAEADAAANGNDNL